MSPLELTYVLGSLAACAVGVAVSVRALLRAAAPVERTCGICGGPIDPDLDSWRWAAHLDSMVHADCIPAWLRAADRTASRGCCHGRGYVQLWLDEGDMRLMNDAANTTA